MFTLPLAVRFREVKIRKWTEGGRQVDPTNTGYVVRYYHATNLNKTFCNM